MSKKQSQEYNGNGEHDWEDVCFHTHRLRVPGGWLYRDYHVVTTTMVFVPMPDVVKHKV